MKKNLLAMVAVALLAGPMAANAIPLNFDLTDGTNNISFELDSNPTPFGTDEFATWFQLPVLVNGVSSSSFVTFWTIAEFGGMDIRPLGAPSLLGQMGPQIFSGTLANPIFAPGAFNMTDGDFGFRDSTYETNFNLVISTVSVPEPGTLALFGLGLAGLGFARRRRATH